MSKFRVGDICYAQNDRYLYYIAELSTHQYTIVPIPKDSNHRLWEDRFNYEIEDFDRIGNLTASSQFDKDLEDLLNEQD